MEQPNTINLHASKIFKIRPEVFIIDEVQKAHRVQMRYLLVRSTTLSTNKHSNKLRIITK